MSQIIKQYHNICVSRINQIYGENIKRVMFLFYFIVTGYSHFEICKIQLLKIINMESKFYCFTKTLQKEKKKSWNNLELI